MEKKNNVFDVLRIFFRGKSGTDIQWPKVILSLSLLATVIGALISTKILTDINKNVALAKEAARPAIVKIVKITTPDCTDCFNLDNAILSFKKLNIKVEEENTITFGSPEADASIKQFAIKKVPTYIVTGDVAKNNLETFVKANGEIKDNTFIFTNLSPVFIDPETKREKGWVTATIITDPSCSQCLDTKTIVESFKKGGIKLKGMKELAWNSLGGQRVINQYKITKVPTFIFSSEFDLYDSLKTSWSNFGTVEQDEQSSSASKTYVARNLPLPYRDLTKGQIAGLTDIIYLTDATCADCYKAQDVQKPILTKGYGVAIRSERFVDISSAEGRSLISKYSITKVPTILVSPEVDQYANLKSVWKSVGTVDKDGRYIFTEMSQLGGVIYKDLTSDQIIKPAGQPSPSPAK